MSSSIITGRRGVGAGVGVRAGVGAGIGVKMGAVGVWAGRGARWGWSKGGVESREVAGRAGMRAGGAGREGRRAGMRPVQAMAAAVTASVVPQLAAGGAGVVVRRWPRELDGSW